MKSKSINPFPNDVFDELGAVLRDYQGPGHVRRRARPARRRIHALPVALAAAIVCAAAGSIIALNVTKPGAPHPSAVASHRLTAPAPTSPRSTAVEPNLPAPRPLSLDDMIKTAAVVFVGRVTDIGTKPIIESNGLGVCSVHYQVERVYRSELGAMVDLGGYCGSEFGSPSSPQAWDWLAAFPAEVGQSYLVFAGWWELWSSGNRILTPAGREQGVYPLTGAGTAANEYNGTVRLDELAQRLESSQSAQP